MCSVTRRSLHNGSAPIVVSVDVLAISLRLDASIDLPSH